MAKKTGGAVDRLSALVPEIEADAYAWGKADARTEFLAALGVPDVSAPAPRRNRPPGHSRRASGGRAGVSGRRAPWSSGPCAAGRG